MNKVLKKILAGLVCSMIVAVFATSETHAAINEGDAIYQKAFYEGVVTCYMTNESAGGLVGQVELNTFDGSVNALVPNANGLEGGKVVPILGSNKGSLSNGLPGISCATLLSSKTAMKVSSGASRDTAQNKKTLENLQYTLESGSTASDSKKCLSFKYVQAKSDQDRELKDTPTACIEGSGGNRVWQIIDNGSGIITFTGAGTSILTITVSANGPANVIPHEETQNVELSGKSDGEAFKTIGDALTGLLDTNYAKAKFAKSVGTVSSGTSGNIPITARFYAACYSFTVGTNRLTCNGTESGFSLDELGGTFGSAANLSGTYNKPSVDRSGRSTVIPKILQNLSGDKYKTYGGLALTEKEVYKLYYSYLQDYFGMSDFQCSDTAISTDRNFKDIKMWDPNSGKWMEHCNFDANGTESVQSGSTFQTHTIEVWGVFDDGERRNHFGNAITLEQLVERIKSMNITDNPGVVSGSSGGSNGNSTNNTSSNSNSNSSCYGSSLGSTEWILCPAMENMQYTASGLDKIVQDWLEVKSNSYDSNSNLRIGWEVVRNVANIAMIGALVVIIFSQITGYGIDNYGIKKMLPKLILVAILINLSFVICQVAVDASNILGVGLRNLFGSIGGALDDPELTGNEFIGRAIAGIFTASSALGTVVGMAGGAAAFVTGGGLAVIIVILALIPILLAVLTFFIMLGARQIIIILCIVLAPIAFVAYILPNTQSFFKRWWKLFEAALVIFPICGALGGISVMVRGLLGSGDELWQWVVAMLLPYLPFFLLPALLRGALSALGTVGGAITAGLTALRTGANKAIDTGRGALQGTEAYKNAQNEAARRRQERNAQRILNRTNGSVDALKAQAANGDRRAQRLLRMRENAQQTMNQLTNEQERANAGATLELTPEMAARRAQSGIDAQRFKENQEEFAGYDKNELQQVANNAGSWLREPGGTQRMTALIQAMESQGMQSNIYDMLRRNNVSNNAGIMQSLSNSSDKILKAYGKKGAGVDYSAFMSGTGAGSLHGYAQEKGADFLNGLDDKSLAEILRTGGGALSDAQLMQAAASMTGQDAVDQVDGLIRQRISQRNARGESAGFQFSADQLSRFNSSTMSLLAQHARTDSDLQNAIVAASSGMTQEQVSKLDPSVRQQINNVRANAMGNGQDI